MHGGGMCGGTIRGRGLFGRGDMHGGGSVWQGACMVDGVYDRGHLWQETCMARGVHGRGSMCGRGWGHAWQGVAWWVGKHGRGGGVHGGGPAWQGVCMAGGHAWQEGVRDRGACMAGETATAVGGTHPCYFECILVFYNSGYICQYSINATCKCQGDVNAKLISR